MPTYPEIHYLWVGPPTAFNPMALPGHDIAGPISLGKEFQKEIYKEKNIIKFWCLGKYQAYYQELYKSQGIEIEVCSIEKLLEENKKLDDGAAKALSENLAEISQAENMSMGDLMDFKDRFSLFLLMKQPGYFFDTNIFAKEGQKLELSQQEHFSTAKSDFSGLNDFYLMYSPNNNVELQQAFLRRVGFPINMAGMTFYNLPLPSLDLNVLGVQKESYKSYMSDVPGLFRLLELNFEQFEAHCKYADINQQVPCPFSKRVISECSLCWLSQTLTPEIIKTLPIPTDYAYIAGILPVDFSFDVFRTEQENPPRIYFYDRKKDVVILVDDEASSIYSDYFPIDRLNEGFFDIEEGTAKKLNALMGFFREREPTAHPPVLVNIEGGTLLHHAVMSNDIEKVTWLINKGARLDLKALYQIQPSEPDIGYEYTPLELAKFLKLDAILDLLQEHSKKQPAVEFQEPFIHQNSAQQVGANLTKFEEDKLEIQKHFEMSLQLMKDKLDSLAKNDLSLQKKGQTLFDTLSRKQKEFFKELKANSTEEEIVDQITDFRKFCKENVKIADKIMGHGWLYRIVEVLIKAVVGLFAGIGMILGSVLGQGLVKSDHREKFAETFFKLNQNEQSQALNKFKQEVLGDNEENQGLISSQNLKK